MAPILAAGPIGAKYVSSDFFFYFYYFELGAIHELYDANLVVFRDESAPTQMTYLHH